MCLLDVTGSFTYATSATDNTPRKDTVREMMGTLVRELEDEDSQAGHEEHGGGLRTITFAGGVGTDIGDLNSRNLNERWATINWAGGTQIMPGWILLQQVYMSEFGHRLESQRPALMAIVITDGEASDLHSFEQTLASDLNSYVVAVVMGYGKEHAGVMDSFRRVAGKNPRVRVVDFAGGVDPYQIAMLLKQMVAS